MIGSKVCFFQTIDSTNTHMKDHIQEFKHGDMVCARIQTDGRGRRERKWVSKDGNLHTSFLVDTDTHDYDSFEVVMRTSLAVVQMLKNYDIQSMIKYPNDIIVNRHKIAGILIEKVKDRFIVGLGVNVSFGDKDMYAFHPSSILLETGRFVDYRDVLSSFIDSFNALSTYNRSEITELYKGYSFVIDKKILIDKKELLVIDINTKGELVVQDQDITKTYTPNEVTLADLYE